ncbi:MAG TPA: aldo/keto reductase [Thermomicrobiales bacterium]|nr:aldo/keto reductase [Thermomicrobiales bacterium]
MTMHYGTIDGVDKPVSRLVQGTIPLSSGREEESFRLLDEIFELGCRTFDTAHNYGRGDCETVFGAWMRDRGVREEIVVLGKGAHPYDGRERVTPEDITADLHDSLARQQHEYFDMYLLHRDNPSLPVGPIVEVLNQHKRDGKISIFGGSNWSTSRIAEANTYARENGLEPFAVSSPNFSLAVQIQPPWEGCISISGDVGKADREWYRENNMPIVPWSSLAGGFFSGRFTRDNVDEMAANGDYFEKLCVASYCSEENFQRLDRVREMAERDDMTIPQVAMAYVMSQPQEIFALVGCRNGNEFAENAAMLDRRLTQEELDWLDLTSDNRPW